MIKYCIASLLITLLFITNETYSQTNAEKFKFAEDLIEDGNYHKALEVYQQLLNEFPNNANLNFKAGFCYLNTATEKVKSIPYLEFASKYISETYKIADFSETGAPIEVLFYLGKAYHVNYRFNDAENTFIDLKARIGAVDKNFESEINHQLSACQVARSLIKSPVEMKVTNLSRLINSTFAEHSPVISGDESLLIFTSKRKENTGGRMTDDGQYFEDIYISSFDGEKYTQAQKISENINTPGHEASIGLSFDGSKLFIYKDDENDGNIYVSNRKGAEWLAPEKLPEPINSKSRESHASMSFDQNELFFTSDRKGGYGGLDIYRVRKLPNGNWSKAQNLGPNINTPYDEEGPYLHPDGTSLYFASKGHSTMGGFDIFVSYVDENEKWEKPKNIGYPINTPDDDVYYVPSVDGRRAYYSSYANNSIGNYDIFRIDLSETHVRNQTVIAGIAMSATGILLENTIITITNSDGDIQGIYTPDPETKKFLFILPRGKSFTALFESSNVGNFEYSITVPNYSYDQSKQVVVFNEIIIPAEREKQLKTETIAEVNKTDKKLNKLEDSLHLDNKTLEAKSIGPKTNKASEFTSSQLLVASELYKNDTYIETTAKNRNEKDSLYNDSVLLSEGISNKSNISGEANSQLTVNNDSNRHPNPLINKTLIGVLLGLIFVGSTIFIILRRKRN